MHLPLICHFLIGPPGSGKSTLAALLAQQGNYRIVSTDQIRWELFGDESLQGDWSTIEEKVISLICQAVESGCPVIYDATNAKRVWRMELLMKLDCALTPLFLDGKAVGRQGICWMAWLVQTPLETCKAWNQKRSRQVPDQVIEGMFQSLQDFPPMPAEGFAAVCGIANTAEGFDLAAIQDLVNQLNITDTPKNCW